jgi:hypothetical protein
MLLTHTSGFTYSWYNQHLRNWVLQNPNAEVSAERFVPASAASRQSPAGLVKADGTSTW